MTNNLMDNEKLYIDLELLEEVELLTAGLSDNEYVKIDSKNILFKHLNILYGNSCKIRVEDLMNNFSETNNLKESIVKSNVDMGRPRGEPKRRVRSMWPVEIADCLEQHRDWIEKNWEKIGEMAGEVKDESQKR